MPVDSVPLLDLTRRSPELMAELQTAFEAVLSSGRYIMGPQVEAFENECADYVGVRHAVGVSSGTDALLISMMALGIGPGDEVICPTYSFFSTAGCIARLGASIVFCDIDPFTYTCDPGHIEQLLTERTRAILPVHLFGQCADMQAVMELANSRGVVVIEDAAQALGAGAAGAAAGSIGQLGCFSFFPSKNLGGFGDSGLVTTNDDELAATLRTLRVHGGKPKYHHKLVGGNFRIDTLHAALLRPLLRRLDTATQRRQANAARYSELLLDRGLLTEDGSGSRPLTAPAVEQSRHIFNQYVLRVSGDGRRDRLRDYLRDRRIGTEVYYPIPLHLQDCFASYGHKPGDFPVAEAAANETLAIPVFPELSSEEMDYVVESLAGFFAQD